MDQDLKVKNKILKYFVEKIHETLSALDVGKFFLKKHKNIDNYDYNETY